MELARLGDAAIGTLVETALGGPLEQRALRWVVERSQGNPLYARELVLGTMDGGSLVEVGGLWRLSGSPAVSRTLIELVAERIALLDGDIRQALELLALGEPLRVEEMAALSTYPALEAAEFLGLLTVAAEPGGDVLRLAHPLHGEALRADLPRLRANQLRLQLARTLERREPLGDDEALRVARLLSEASAPIPAGLLVGAARAAIHAGDPELGARLARQAVAEGAGLSARCCSRGRTPRASATRTRRRRSPPRRTPRARTPPPCGTSSSARRRCSGA